jgi:4-hydroxy-tetrahydrodipicolinate synthase
MSIEFTKSEAKNWAKLHLKGIETVIFPSFTPDLEKLDEEGIRYDVNHIIANGFTSIMVSPESWA